MCVVDFSGCPALVELSMDRCHVFVTRLLSPSLKHLRLVRCYSSDYTRILISLPCLVSLELIECQGKVPLLGSLPSLATTIVELDGDCSDRCSEHRFDGCDDCDGCRDYYEPGDDLNNCVFLKGLSEATDLELSAFADVVCLQLLLSQFLILFCSTISHAVKRFLI